MARLKLPRPEPIIYSTHFSVLVEHLNYGGHVGNDRFLAMAHEARLRWLKEHGADELNFLGSGLIMRDSAVVYKKELFWGEEVHVDLGIDDPGPSSFDLLYHLRSKQGESYALIKTGMVLFDYRERKIVRANPDQAKLIGLAEPS